MSETYVRTWFCKDHGTVNDWKSKCYECGKSRTQQEFEIEDYNRRTTAPIEITQVQWDDVIERLERIEKLWRENV